MKNMTYTLDLLGFIRNDYQHSKLTFSVDVDNTDDELAKKYGV